MPHALLPRIESSRASRLLNLSRSRRGQLQIANAPPCGASGFYWIFTDYTLEELKACIHSSDKGAINIGRLSALHEGLPHVCKIETDGFRLVYNGIAGPGCGIKERIHQHFNGGTGTGCLSIGRSTLPNLQRWRVSYATVMLRHGLAPDVASDYSTLARDLERMWRLRYGWPLLCKT